MAYTHQNLAYKGIFMFSEARTNTSSTVPQSSLTQLDAIELAFQFVKLTLNLETQAIVNFNKFELTCLDRALQIKTVESHSRLVSLNWAWERRRNIHDRLLKATNQLSSDKCSVLYRKSEVNQSQKAVDKMSGLLNATWFRMKIMIGVVLGLGVTCGFWCTFIPLIGLILSGIILSVLASKHWRHQANFKQENELLHNRRNALNQLKATVERQVENINQLKSCLNERTERCNALESFPELPIIIGIKWIDEIERQQSKLLEKRAVALSSVSAFFSNRLIVPTEKPSQPPKMILGSH